MPNKGTLEPVTFPGNLAAFAQVFEPGVGSLTDTAPV